MEKFQLSLRKEKLENKMISIQHIYIRDQFESIDIKNIIFRKLLITIILFSTIYKFKTKNIEIITLSLSIFFIKLD